jgi:hypothetical protein
MPIWMWIVLGVWGSSAVILGMLIFAQAKVGRR